MVLELENHYASKGYGCPKYSFTNSVDENGFKVFNSELVLPNGITIRGESKKSCVEVCICFLSIF